MSDELERPVVRILIDSDLYDLRREPLKLGEVREAIKQLQELCEAMELQIGTYKITIEALAPGAKV
jgi:hypothetical protein